MPPAAASLTNMLQIGTRISLTYRSV